MTHPEILDTPFIHPDFDDPVTFRSIFTELLLTLFEKEERFSGKRPFGNSGWKYHLAAPLIQWKVIEGTLDEYGHPDHYDREAVETVFTSLIKLMGEESLYRTGIFQNIPNVSFPEGMNLKFKYTKEIPKEPGWYWIREAKDKEYEKIAEIYVSMPNGKLRLKCDGLIMFPDERFEYSEPILKPEE